MLTTLRYFQKNAQKKNNIETFIHVICCNNSINSILQTIFFMTFDYVKLRLLKIKRTFLIFLFLPLVSSSLNSWHDLVVQHSIAGEYKFCSISHFRGRANYYWRKKKLIGLYDCIQQIINRNFHSTTIKLCARQFTLTNR